MADQRSTLSLLIAAKDQASDVFRRFAETLRSNRTETQKLSESQRRAAADPAYLRSQKFLIDRARELDLSTRKVRSAIQTVTAGLQSTDKAAVDKYRDAVRTLRSEIDNAEVKTERATAATRRHSREMDRSKTSALSLNSVMKRLVVTFGAFIGLRAFSRLMRENITLFFAQDKAVNDLRSALLATGKDGVESLEALSKQAGTVFFIR